MQEVLPQIYYKIKPTDEFRCPFCNSNCLRVSFELYPYPAWCNDCDTIFHFEIEGKEK